MYFNKTFLKQNQGFIICINLVIDHLPVSLSLSVSVSVCLFSFSQRSSGIKGTNDPTTAESPTSSPGQRPNSGRPRPQVWPIWSWLVGGQCRASFSWTRPRGSLQGRLSQRTEKSSKAQKLVSYQEYLPTQGWTPGYERHDSTALSADALPKRSTVHMGTELFVFYHPGINGLPL